MAEDVKRVRFLLYVLYSLIFVAGTYLSLCGRTASGIVLMSVGAFMAFAVCLILGK